MGAAPTPPGLGRRVETPAEISAALDAIDARLEAIEMGIGSLLTFAANTEAHVRDAIDRLSGFAASKLGKYLTGDKG